MYKKKLLAAALVICLLGSLAACGSSDSTPSDTAEKAADSSEDEESYAEDSDNGSGILCIDAIYYIASMVTSSGDLYMWECSDSGFLSNLWLYDDSIVYDGTPVKLMENIRYAEFDTVITEDNDLYVWGIDNDSREMQQPQKILSDVQSISVGSPNIAITNSGDLYMWGIVYNDQYEEVYYDTPVQIDSGIKNAYPSGSLYDLIYIVRDDNTLSGLFYVDGLEMVICKGYDIKELYSTYDGKEILFLTNDSILYSVNIDEKYLLDRTEMSGDISELVEVSKIAENVSQFSSHQLGYAGEQAEAAVVTNDGDLYFYLYDGSQLKVAENISMIDLDSIKTGGYRGIIATTDGKIYEFTLLSIEDIQQVAESFAADSKKNLLTMKCYETVY